MTTRSHNEPVPAHCSGRTLVDWTEDNPERYGPPHRDGKIGLRQMTPTIGLYRNFRVWALTDERR